MDQELKTFLEEREARMEERMDERFARMEARMNERFEQVGTEIRHTRVLVEAVHSDVRLVAEGVMGVSESQQALREETAHKLEEIKTLVTPYQSLNSRVQNQDNRLKLLEEKAERQTRDVLEVIREKFGKPQA